METATIDHVDAYFREKVLRARQQSPGEKWDICVELHELAIATMRAGIQAQHPEFDDAGLDDELDRRLRIRRQLDEQGIYSPISCEGNST